MATADRFDDEGTVIPVSPLRGEWRCSNCAAVADRLDAGTLIDSRYAMGWCGTCKLRAKLPLIRGTYEDVASGCARGPSRLTCGRKSAARHPVGTI
jgi:hypothetical protein